MNAGNIGSTYSWNTSDTTSVLTLDSAGTYILLVIDDNGCASIDTIVFDFHPEIFLTATGQGPSCFGDADGSVIANASGGVVASFLL